MQTYPDKFQAIMFGKSGFENCKSLDICDSLIQCEEQLNFSMSLLLYAEF